MFDNSKLSGFILTINMTIEKKAQTVPAQFISFKSKKPYYLIFYYQLKTVIRPLK